MQLEICVDSLESANNAQYGGADRIELCSTLAMGGLTPSAGMLRAVKKTTAVPVFVMLRPRAGNFVYSDSEMTVVMEDLRILKHEGADGFVFGALKKDFTVDDERCRQVLTEAKPLPVTFHRAFDLVSDWTGSAMEISSLGFDRILTSGLKPTAIEGVSTLREMMTLSASRGHSAVIVAGSGVNERNLLDLIENTGVKEFHSSASVEMPSVELALKMGHSDTNTHKITCWKRVAAMKTVLRQFSK